MMKWVVAVYLWHLVYGFKLGAFYQPKDIPETPRPDGPHGRPRPTDTRASGRAGSG